MTKEIYLLTIRVKIKQKGTLFNWFFNHKQKHEMKQRNKFVYLFLKHALRRHKFVTYEPILITSIKRTIIIDFVIKRY